MERHTFTVNFWASPSKARKTGLMPIYVTIRMNGERATFTTGKYIHPNDWDEVWAPVNCGYHKTDFKYGKLYQWGRPLFMW